MIATKIKKNIFKILLGIVLAFVMYIIVTGVLPYVRPQKLNEEYKTQTYASQFYGDTECADRVALVEEPIKSLATRLFLIRQAEKTLDISYYGIHEGETTDYFFAEILRAADRGVKVRLLFDGMRGNLSFNKEMGRALASHENIEFKLYNEINILKPWTYNGRLHDKYIIVDDKLLLLGGRNIGDKYFGPESYTGNLSIDRDVLVFNTLYEDTRKQESVIFTLRDYMDGIWNSEYVSAYKDKSSKKTDKEVARLKSFSEQLDRDLSDVDIQELDFYDITYPANKVSLISNDIHIYKKEPKVMFSIATILAESKGDVYLQSPYIVPDKNMFDFFNYLGESDKSFVILTNSMASSPNIPAFSGYTAYRDKILKTGAEVYEFQSKHAIHSKTYIADERLSLVGSNNLDPRSQYIDTELMLAIDSEQFTDELSDVIKDYIDHSLLVDAGGSYIENSEVSTEKVSFFKRLLINTLSFPARIFKFLL